MFFFCNLRLTSSICIAFLINFFWENIRQLGYLYIITSTDYRKFSKDIANCKSIEMIQIE